jgi:hypothetical protein
MAWVGFTPLLGEVDVQTVDPNGPGPLNLVAGTGAGRMSWYGQIIEGYDAALGGGEFIYAKAAANITAGQIVEFVCSQDGSGNMVLSAQPWAGTANSGKELGVAVVAVPSGSWAWFQIEGCAVVACSGSPTVNAQAYWQASGVASGTAVASKHILGAQWATTNNATVSGRGALGAGFAVMLICRPCAQGAIT